MTLFAGLTLFAGGCGQTPDGPNTNLFEGMQSVAVTPTLTEAPVWMTIGCPSLVKLREREPSQAEAEGEWRADEKLYEDCRIRHAALRNFYRKRDAALTKVDKQ